MDLFIITSILVEVSIGAVWLLVPVLGWLLNMGHRIMMVHNLQKGLLALGVGFLWTSVWFWQVAAIGFAGVFTRRFDLDKRE